jgi:hypothetical protein
MLNFPCWISVCGFFPGQYRIGDQEPEQASFGLGELRHPFAEHNVPEPSMLVERVPGPIIDREVDRCNRWLHEIPPSLPADVKLDPDTVYHTLALGWYAPSGWDTPLVCLQDFVGERLFVAYE